jgi:lipoprotein signal peptidase
MARRYKLLLIWVLVIVVVDQYTKYWATTYLYTPSLACVSAQELCVEGCGDAREAVGAVCRQTCDTRFRGCLEVAQTNKSDWEARQKDLASSMWCRSIRATGLLGAPECVVIPGLLSFRYARNPGTAWGVFGSLPTPLRRSLFVLITLLAFVFLSYLLRQAHEEEKLLIASLIGIFSGAIGNFLDRLRMNHVIDFLDVYIQTASGSSHWPTFNIADIAISVGVVLMVLHSFTAKPMEASARPKTSS